MDIVVAVILILTLLACLVVAGVATVHRRQQRALGNANQLIPGRPTRAPRSWAVSHDPEARLHRRLRDAMTALHAVNAVDTGTTIVLRADLEQTALDLDDHLVAVAQLAPNHRDEMLATITTTVESIEAAVARYAAATTMPDATTLESDLATVQQHLDVTREVQRRLTA
ncbi:hypothetical protein [Mycobacterium camsae]|uniref:hypothetical protein n=1 Tax=Mycobacterium gordonae TaxID=1778 RepID=UPI001980FC1B|nr:hypothetical protein [Mycobacterium gordonae]